jgi:hypothetical protein
MNSVLERRQPRALPAAGRVSRRLWELLWLPYWLGSTLPPPVLPTEWESRRPAEGRTPTMLRRLDELRAIIWRQRAGILGFRSLWLALAAVDLGLALRVIAHRDVRLLPFLLVALLILVLGAWLIVVARPARGQLARTLDRSFGLRERVSTALEGTQRGRLTGLRALQVLEATRVTEELGEARAFQRHLPIREICLAAVAFVALVALLLAFLLTGGGVVGAEEGSGPVDVEVGQQTGVGPQAGDMPAGPNPGPADQGQQGEQGQGEGDQQGQAPGPSPQDQRDLDTVAGALKDHAATRRAAGEMQAGDYAGAADALRDVGRNASKLSPEARRALAGDMRRASGQMTDPNGQLAQDLKRTAEALERPNASGAEQAFNDLARDVERAGEGEPQGPNEGQGSQQNQGSQGNTGNEGAQSGSQAGQNAGQPSGGGGPGTAPNLPSEQRQQQPGQGTPLLGADGNPVELPKGDPNGPQVRSQAGQNQGAPPQPGSANAGEGQLRQGDVGETGLDPNGVPLDQRRAIEQYFTPRADEE